MSDAPLTPAKPGFRLHLSTAILLMAVAGLLLGLNLYVFGVPEYYLGGRTGLTTDAPFYGWPWPVHAVAHSRTAGRYFQLQPMVIVVDLAINFAILGYVYSFWERLLRRREADDR